MAAVNPIPTPPPAPENSSLVTSFGVTGSGPAKLPDDGAYHQQMADMQSQLHSIESQPLPKFPSQGDMPKLPDHPIVDPHQWQNLGVMLVGMAMLTGGLGKNWLNSAAALSGAVNGYAQGNEEAAKNEYARFQMAYKEAVTKQQAALQQYNDILKNRQLSMNEIIAQMRQVATEHHDQAMEAAAQQRNFTEMEGVLTRHQDALARIGATASKAAQSLHGDPATQGAMITNAWLWFKTGDKSIRYSIAPSEKAAFNQALDTIRQEMHLSPEQFATIAGTNQAQSFALRPLQERYNLAQQNNELMDRNLNLALSLAPKVSRTQIPLINKALISGDMHILGSSDAVAYVTALRAAASEYARIRTNNFTGRATAEGARTEIEELVNAAETPEQLQAQANVMRQDGYNVLQSYQNTMRVYAQPNATIVKNDFGKQATTPGGAAGTEQPSSTTVDFQEYMKAHGGG